MKQSRTRERILKLIRLNIIILLFTLFCSGIFLDNGNLYAQERNSIAETLTNPFINAPITNIGIAPKSVRVKRLDDEYNLLVYSNSAKDILEEGNIVLDLDDEIMPSPEAYIPHLGTIVIVKVDSFVHTEIVSIPQKVVEVKDPNLDKGKSVVQTDGNNGLKEITVQTIFKDNTEYKKKIIAETILVEASNKVIRVGTRPTTVHSCSYWNKVINDVAPKEKNPEKNAWMRFVMLCESGCDSGKGVEKYFQGSKAFYGLYQFTEYTFKAYGGKNLFDGYDQIKVVSRMYDLKGNPAHHWPACNSAFEREYNR